MSILAHLQPLERKLQAAGFPAMTAWWRATLKRFYESGRRQLTLRVGRRGGKSSSLCRIAVLEALYGGHTVPPGDVGVVAFISTTRDEAAQRLRTIKAILDALHVGYRPIDHGIELEGRPIAFKTYVATISGVSGFTAICVICDEVAKWKDADTGANPATEVLASLRPTLAGQDHARIFLSSSPMGKDDAHARFFDQSETVFQITAGAETWVARPALTEAMCRELEPDADTFAREYGIVPFDGSTASFFTGPMLDAVTRQEPLIMQPERGATYIAGQDPAARGNAWTLAIVRARDLGEELTMVDVCLVREWRAPRGAALDSDATLHEIAGVLRAYGVSALWQDQWSFDALRPLAARHGISLLQQPATGPLNVQRYEALRRRVVDRTISLPPDPVVRADLLGVRRWLGKGGGFSIELERVGTRHADTAPAICLAVDKAIVGEPGIIGFYRDEARAAQGLPPRRAPGPVAESTELVPLALPARFAGTSHFLALSGETYRVDGGRILAKAADLEDLRKIGFTHP